ncbi:MAG: acyltransferase [Bacteroidales bacterium]|jgi:acetyltransferase-like isoleucine patch superfamily enzyme|nr:acyltransferase [Bacteroidales bacterium]
MSIKEKINHNPQLKRCIFTCIMHPVKARPRWWVRVLQFVYMKRGKHSVIYRSVRRDIPPFNKFSLGAYSVIEDFSTINNAVGDLMIGDHTRVGLGNTVIGPVTIGNRVNIAQNVTVTGLNHIFEDVSKSIDEQGISTKAVEIKDDVWIGANAVILPGVTIGEHAVVAAGSIVTRAVPPYSVCAGNPAKVVKYYDFDKNEWMLGERANG